MPYGTKNNQGAGINIVQINSMRISKNGQIPKDGNRSGIYPEYNKPVGSSNLIIGKTKKKENRKGYTRPFKNE